MNSWLTALLNGFLGGVVLTVLVWLALLAIPRRALNAATRYWLWWATLAAVTLLPCLYLPLGVGLPSALPASSSMVRIEPLPSVQRAAESRPPIPQPVASNFRGSRLPVVVTAGPWVGWILSGGLLLITGRLLRLLMSWMLLRGTRISASPAPAHLAARLPLWLAQCGSRVRGVQLRISNRIASPMVAGLTRPTILLPETLLEQLSEAEVGQIGLHEAAHLARADHYALLVQRVLQALFAWHPAVGWIARRIDFERELACDDVVLGWTGQAGLYALCLTRVVELAGTERSSKVALAMAVERSRLSKRVELLLDRTRHSGTKPSRPCLVLASVALGAFVWLGAQTPKLMAVTGAPVEQAVPLDHAALVEPVATPLPTAVEEVPAPPVHAPIEEAPKPQIPQPSQPLVQVSVQDVLVVHVTVSEPQGRQVTGLSKTNFRIFDRDVEQEITGFEAPREPLSLAIVVDASGSTRTVMDSVRRTVSNVLSKARPADEFCLITVHDIAEVAAGWTGDRARIESRLSTEEPRGGTALLDGIALAVQQLRQSHTPFRGLLIVSEGDDNTSRISESSLRDLVRESDLQVFAISLEDATERRTSNFLRALAAQEHGWHIALQSAGSLPADAASGLFQGGYVLRYIPRGLVHDGQFHSLRVTVVAPPGMPELTVRARPGYYAPGPPR